MTQASLVVVPVTGISRLTAEGVSVALSLGDDVIAVTVVYTDEADDPDNVPDVDFRAEWEAWRPGVPLLTLHSAHRSLAKPIVRYLRSVEAEDKYHRLVVLIPEVEPSKAVGVDPAQPARHHPGAGDPPWHEQRGAVPPAVPAGDAHRRDAPPTAPAIPVTAALRRYLAKARTSGRFRHGAPPPSVAR